MAEIKEVARCQKFLDSLNDQTCEYCKSQLIIGTYKNTDALLCASCNTPAIRFW